MSMSTLEIVHADVNPKDFFERFVCTRTPVVIKGLTDDSRFEAMQKWKDVDYLRSEAGHVEVTVEPMDLTSHQFGTGIQRLKTSFGRFLDSLFSEGPHNYLTTQYTDDDSVSFPEAFPPPTNALRQDFPPSPLILSNLVLDQVNLWMGRSKEGTSSGLHHDFHDNLYLLLQGRKRFILFAPQRSKYLYPQGFIERVHSNGLISYLHNPVRSDGLTNLDAARYKVKALKLRLSKAKDVSKITVLTKTYNDARRSLKRLENEGGPDDADAILAQLERQPEPEEWGGLSSDPEPESEPSSFSQIPTHTLHTHLRLPTTSRPPTSVINFPLLPKAGSPFIVNLEEGDALYLPASWWHEVTSSGEKVHMAFNWWFHPPDGETNREMPYRDTLVWRYLRARLEKGQVQVGEREERGSKRRKQV